MDVSFLHDSIITHKFQRTCAYKFCFITNESLLQLGFLVLFSTFTAYFLIPVGQKVLRPTVISLYSYMQPLIATIVSILLGMDRLNWQKIVAAALVFTGVILVNKSRAKKQD